MKKHLLSAVVLLLLAGSLTASEVWETSGFEAFRKGSFGNGGQNIYVSANGILQRIHHSDINNDGEIDLLFCNSQGHEEYVYPVAYTNVLKDPALQTPLRIGGVSSAIAQGDINGDGYEDIVFSCGWNGASWIPNNMIYYGSAEGISNRHIHYLVATGGRPVIGDFNGDGRKDVLFIYGNADKGRVELFANSSLGISFTGVRKDFSAPEMKQEANYIASVISVPDKGGDGVLMRMNNGGINIFRNITGTLDLTPQVLLEPDPDFKDVKSRWNNFQFVAPPKPLLRTVKINDTLYVFAARENSAGLYPYSEGKLDKSKALIFKINKAMSVSAGKVRSDKLVDLVFAANDFHDGKECSWYYPAAADGGYPEASRVHIPSYRANDIMLADLGGKTLSLVVMQNNAVSTYNGSTLLYKEFTGAESLAIVPEKLPCGDARMILTPRMGDRQQLVLPHTRTGNTTSILPVTIYTGKNGSYDPQRKIDLMSNGALDGVFADMDNNGYADVVLAHNVEMSPHLNDGSYIYFNGPDGFEKEPVKLPTKLPGGCVVADFDRDGNLDVVFSSVSEGELTFYYGQGKRSFKQQTVKLGKKCITLWLGAADCNNDGFLDLVVPVVQDNKSCILWGGKDGFDYSRRQDFNVAKTTNVKIADVNSDGYLDLAFCGYYPSVDKPHDSYLTIFYGSKEGYQDHRRTMLEANDPTTAAFGDFNNDGLLDIFVGAYDNKRSRELDSHIYWQDPKLGFTKDNRTFLRTEAACGGVAGDFNNDGWLDLAIANHKINTKHVAYSQVWYNNKGTFSSENTIKLPTSGPHGMINIPWQNIADRSASEYYTSAVYQRKNPAEIMVISLDGVILRNNKVKVALRSADTPEDLNKAQFKAVAVDSALSLKDFPGKYLQYRLELIAKDGVGTPMISKVTVSFDRMPEGAIKLPPPQKTGGKELMECLSLRKSTKSFQVGHTLDKQTLSNLLYAAGGINRPNGKWTIPTARNLQNQQIYIAMPEGIYLYKPSGHLLELVGAGDYRKECGRQSYHGNASVVLIYVSDTTVIGGSAAANASCSGTHAGSAAQNVYLYAASQGLGTVICGNFDGVKLAKKLQLLPGRYVVYIQPVGLPAENNK